MKFASLNDLYLQQLKDLHSAESQLIKALPKMAKAARNPDLRNAFIEHLEQTKGHLDRLKHGCRDHRGGQRVEHYEMARYGTVQTFAKLLGEKEAAELFTLTLNEEKAADKKLSLLAKSINVKAKAEKPPPSVKTAVKESAKLPVKIPSGGQREVQGIESNMEAKQSQPE